jgi:small subunit ribosomal protein S2
MKDISLVELLKSGAHFGHTTSRWNPKMKPYIYTVRNNIHILDLEKTRKSLLKALSFITDSVSKGQTVLFVGTKRQAKDITKKAAVSCGSPYVNVRWLGGMFTNFKTIQKTIRKLEKLQETTSALDFNERYTKKERLQMTREIEKMTKLFEGVKDLRKLPDIVVVLDVNYDKIAVTEAKKSGVKVVGIADSNSNPDTIDYIIPANDDATKTIDLIASCLAEAVMDGKKRASVSTQA